MPRNTREWARRKLQEAVLHFNYSGTHLNQVREVYNKDHPDIGGVLENCMEVLEELEKTISALRRSI